MASEEHTDYETMMKSAAKAKQRYADKAKQRCASIVDVTHATPYVLHMETMSTPVEDPFVMPWMIEADAAVDPCGNVQFAFDELETFDLARKADTDSPGHTITDEEPSVVVPWMIEADAAVDPFGNIQFAFDKLETSDLESKADTDSPGHTTTDEEPSADATTTVPVSLHELCLALAHDNDLEIAKALHALETALMTAIKGIKISNYKQANIGQGMSIIREAENYDHYMKRKRRRKRIC